MKGWIKICRSITDHWIWRSAEYLKWWCDLLLMASWQGEKRLVGRQLVTLQRGQLIASGADLRKRWGCGKDKIARFLQLLQGDAMIKRKSHNNITIITICNYERYQAPDNLCGSLNQSASIDYGIQQGNQSANLPTNLLHRITGNQSANLCDSVTYSSIEDCSVPQGHSADNLLDNIPDDLSTHNNKEYNNIIDVVDKGACAHEEFKSEVMTELKMQQACKSLALSSQQYEQLANEVISDWEFANEADWSYKHFLNTMRRKAVAMRKSQNQSTKRDKINDLWKQ